MASYFFLFVTIFFDLRPHSYLKDPGPYIYIYLNIWRCLFCAPDSKFVSEEQQDMFVQISQNSVNDIHKYKSSV